MGYYGQYGGCWVGVPDIMEARRLDKAVAAVATLGFCLCGVFVRATEETTGACHLEDTILPF